jgi:hypothetical protein
MGNTWNHIAILPGNPGVYFWKVPFVWSNTCKVRVRLNDAAEERVAKDNSNGTFIIQPYP